MSQQRRLVRIVVGLAFLVSAVALFAGLVSLGAMTTVVAAVDLVVGLVLVASGFRDGGLRRTPESY